MLADRAPRRRGLRGAARKTEGEETMKSKSKGAAAATTAPKKTRNLKYSREDASKLRALLERTCQRLGVVEEALWKIWEMDNSIAAADCWLVAANQLRVTTDRLLCMQEPGEVRR